MSKGRRVRDARREAREFRERQISERASAYDAIDVVEIALPNMASGVPATATVRRPMLTRLIEDGIVREHQGRYYADDRDLLIAQISTHPETMVCDFCSNVEPLWRYEAKNTALFDEIRPADAKHERETTTHGSLSAWIACDRCSSLIERGEYQQLIDVVGAELAAKFGAETHDARAVMGLMLVNVVGTFLDAREGDRRLL